MEQRIVLSLLHGNTIPFYVESIGFNCNQENLIRTQGYPFYHWLQTVKGAGEIYIDGRKYIAEPQSGILISPHMPHSYESISVQNWETVYLTFGGGKVKEIVDYIQIHSDALYL